MAGSTMRRLVALAWPVVGLNVLGVLSLAVDTAMLGRAPDAEVALTGVGFSAQLAFLLMVAMIGLSVGSVATVARAFGAGDRDRVGHVLQQAVQLTVGLSLTIAVVGNVAAPWLLRALGAEGPALDAGLAYLRPLLLGTVFNYLLILFGAVLRAVGNTTLAFAVSLLMNALNVVFNYALILGRFGLPALGVTGAAIGTVTAQAIALVVMVALLRRGVVPGVSPRLSTAPVDRPLVGALARVGWPAAADMLVLNAGFLSIIGMLGRIDPVAVAAHGVGLRVQALAFVPGLGISQATGALVGQALGAGDADEARRVVRASIGLSLLVMGSLAALLMGGSDVMLALFDLPKGTPLHAYATTWLTLLGVGMPLAGVYISLVGMFQGAGATRTSLRINTGVTLLLQIPASALLGFGLGFGPWGVWAAFPLSFIVKAALAGVAYRAGGWAKTGKRV